MDKFVTAAVAAVAVLVPAGAGLQAMGFRVVALILYGIAIGAAFALPFLIKATWRSASIAMAAALIGYSALLSIDLHGTPPQWCNQTKPPSEVAALGSSSNRGLLKLDRLSIEELTGPGGGGCARFDVVLRNEGSQPAIVHQAQIEVVKILPLEVTCAGGRGGGGLEPSKNYDTTIDLSSVPTKFALNQVTQQLRPHDTDRFTITARIDPPRNSGASLYITEVRVKLTFDEDQTIESRPILFVSNPNYSLMEFAQRARPTTAVTGPLAPSREESTNLSTTQQLATSSAVKTARVQEILNALKRSPPAVCEFN